MMRDHFGLSQDKRLSSLGIKKTHRQSRTARDSLSVILDNAELNRYILTVYNTMF